MFWKPHRTLRALHERIDELSDRQAHLERRFDKVQGELSTTLRHLRAGAVSGTNGAGGALGLEAELVKRLAALEEWAEAQGGE